MAADLAAPEPGAGVPVRASSTGTGRGRSDLRGMTVGIEPVEGRERRRPRPSGGRRAGRAAFERYERALVEGDVAVLTELFWDDPRCVRYGVADRQYGADEIAAWRRAHPSVPPGRRLSSTVIVAVDDRTAVVSTLFGYPGPAGRGPADPDLGAAGGGLADRRGARLGGSGRLIAACEVRTVATVIVPSMTPLLSGQHSCHPRIDHPASGDSTWLPGRHVLRGPHMPMSSADDLRLLPALVGLAAAGFSIAYVVADVIELVQGGFPLSNSR